ncbi:MAG: amino acid permease [Phycisphaerae bacterium]|nr:amino acid permease [Phycisphaerae bacterium]
MDAVPRRELTLLDSVCLIVGIIVGAGIYQMAPDIARGASGGGGLLALWLVGGLLSLCGAMSYAELATAYPQEGGDYAYLTRAYGRWAGFLFGWIQLAIVRPGDIAVMAFAFATYACAIYDPMKDEPLACSQQLYACLAVVVLTVVNVAGVRQGKWTQNVLTGVKVLGLAAIVGVAVCAPQGVVAARAVEPLPASLALILVLFTFGGWNEMAYVAAEVINPSRNIVRALMLGTASVTVLYLLVNGAFLYTLGYQGLATSQAVATETVSTVFPAKAPAVISALVCISALGAVNGLIFTGARISFAVGADHRVFRPLGRWDANTGTPVRALLLQAVIAIILIVALGSFLNAILYTAAPVYLFYLATSLAVIILRRKEPCVERPYRVWGYPFTTFIFCLTCAFLAYSAVRYKPWIALAALGILLAGIPLYGLSNRRLRASGEATG